MFDPKISRNHPFLSGQNFQNLGLFVRNDPRRSGRRPNLSEHTISVPHIGQAPAFGQSQSDRDVFRLRLAALGFEGALIMMPMTW